VRVNLSMAANGQIIQRLRNVGRKAHGIVQLPNGQLLCLDSETAALIMVEPTTGAVTRLWTVSGGWPGCPSSAEGESVLLVTPVPTAAEQLVGLIHGCSWISSTSLPGPCRLLTKAVS
jgi:hypothetical protein